MTSKCECCGAPQVFHLASTLYTGERITIETKGFASDVDAVNAALTLLREHKRRLQARGDQPQPNNQ